MLICVKCATDLRCEENGVLVARDPHCVQHADLYKCPECGFELITHCGAPVRVELANEYYDRKKGTYRALYRLDTRQYFAALPVKV